MVLPELLEPDPVPIRKFPRPGSSGASTFAAGAASDAEKKIEGAFTARGAGAGAEAGVGVDAGIRADTFGGGGVWRGSGSIGRLESRAGANRLMFVF